MSRIKAERAQKDKETKLPFIKRQSPQGWSCGGHAGVLPCHGREKMTSHGQSRQFGTQREGSTRSLTSCTAEINQKAILENEWHGSRDSFSSAIIMNAIIRWRQHTVCMLGLLAWYMWRVYSKPSHIRMNTIHLMWPLVHGLINIFNLNTQLFKRYIPAFHYNAGSVGISVIEPLSRVWFWIHSAPLWRWKVLPASVTNKNVG